MKRTTRGMSGTKVFVGDWASLEDNYDASLPVIGSPWSWAYPYLRCVDIQAEELEGLQGELTCTYSTEGEQADEFVQVSKEFASRIHDASAGWQWTTAGTVVEQSVPTEEIVTIWRVRVRHVTLPDVSIQSAINHVNDRYYLGVEPGYLRFIGASQDRRYDGFGNLISIDTIYTFEETERPANEFWREPVQDVDANGVGLVYQDKDAENADTYTTDDTLVGTKVYVTGTAGTGDWDTMEDGDGNARFPAIDFALTLGIPTL